MTKKYKDALNGIKSSMRESSMRIHMGAAVCVVVAATVFRVTAIEWCVLILCMSCVISTEIVNTSIERLCDKLHPSKDAGIGTVKDIAAGAVLVFAFFSAIIAIIIFVPKIWSFLYDRNH